MASDVLVAMVQRGWLQQQSPDRLMVRGRPPCFGSQRLSYYLLTSKAWQE